MSGRLSIAIIKNVNNRLFSTTTKQRKPKPKITIHPTRKMTTNIISNDSENNSDNSKKEIIISTSASSTPPSSPSLPKPAAPAATCGVCNTRPSQYTCPRCQVRYCSIQCYREHTTATAAAIADGRNAPATTSNDSSSLCSEAFFRDRVNSIIHLENLEQKQHTLDILQRQSGLKLKSNEGDGSTVISPNATIPENDLDEEELIELLMKLETMEERSKNSKKDKGGAKVDGKDDGGGLDITKLRRLLSPSLRAEFERDIMDGTKVQQLLSLNVKDIVGGDGNASGNGNSGNENENDTNFMMVQEWYPWWRPQIVPTTAAKDSEGNEQEGKGSRITIIEDNNDDHVTDHTAQQSTILSTVDERLLKVPNFRQLTKKQDPSASFDYMLLLYNVVDIIYSSCWMLRLYYGTNNILNDPDILVEATNCILDVSSVLGMDSSDGGTTSTGKSRENRRFHDLSEVLSCCTTASTAAMKHATTAISTRNVIGCNTPWYVLVEDVALIVSSHRMVGRILLEICDIIKSTIKQVKHRDKHQNHQETLSYLRRNKKKLEFYTSWSQQSDLHLFGLDLRDDILAWMEDWKSMAGA